MRGNLRHVAAVVAMLVMAGCGGAGGGQVPAGQAPKPAPSASGGSTLQSVKLMFPFTPGADWGPYVLAEKRGYYKAQGLNVQFLPGKGAAATISEVATGNVDFGYVNLDVAALAHSKGQPVVAIAGIMRKNLFGVFVDRDGPIHSMRDLEGRTLLVTAGDPAMTFYLPAVAKLQGVDVAKINLVTIGAEAKVGSYLSGKGDAMETSVPQFESEVNAKRPSRVLLFADAGINEPSPGIIARQSLLAQHGDLARRFVAASMQGWEAAVRDPAVGEEAERDMAAAYPTLQLSQLLASWKQYQGFFDTDRTKGQPIGWQSSEDWQQALQLLHDYGGLQGSTNPADYFTNAFLPGK